MTRHEFIEDSLEQLGKILEDMEDRDDRTDFSNIIDQIVEIREELTDLHANTDDE